jgi:amylosucrase
MIMSGIKQAPGKQIFLKEENLMGYTKEFEKRLSERKDEAAWLFKEIYNGDQHAFDYFCEMLKRMYDERPNKLKKLDRKRLEDPYWYRSGDVLGMLMYTECFAETLNGVEAKIPYLKENGVNYLHLMPILETPEGRSDGGYAVSDFRKVNPSIGTMADLSDLTDSCHEEGISVCIDFVMNHTSEDHEWALRAKRGDFEYQSRYFFYDNWDIPQQYEKTVPQVFPQTAPGNFTWCNDAGKVVMTTFYPYQWDLNYHNPTVFNDMTENMLFLMNKGVDIIRLDAVPYIWKELGTSCRNLPQVHTLVRLMRIAAEIVAPGTLLLGEVVMEPKEVVPYFGTIDKPECHLLYNVTTMATTWNTVATRDVKLLRNQLDKVFGLPRNYTFLNYLRCHDDIGWGLDYDFLAQYGEAEASHKKFLNDYFQGHIYGSEARGELYNDDPRLKDARMCGTTASLCGIEAAEYEKNKDKLDRGIALDIMLHAFLLTLPGPPILYSGDEIGLLNDYTYHENPLKQSDSRYLHRGKFDWDQAALRKRPSTRQGKIYAAIKRLRKARKSHKAFNSDADIWTVDTGNDHVLGIGRYYNGEKIIALFNFNVFPEKAHLAPARYTDMFSKEKAQDVIELPTGGFAWLIEDIRPTK